MIMGIDFGTCFSTVAIMTGMIPDATYVRDSTGMGMPTLFMYNSKTNTELYGEQCETSEAWGHADDVVKYIKRLIRENSDNINAIAESGGKSFTYKYIIEQYLRFIIAEAKKGAQFSGNFPPNDPIEEITVTVPVGISKDQMMATEYNRLIKDIMVEITSLPDSKIHILQEPVGAAISYLYNKGVMSKVTEKQTVLVFDLGGGTLDVTVVEHNPNNKTQPYRIRAKEGDLRLGGNDWDEVLAKEIKKRTGVEEFTSIEEKAKFDREITKLKVNLSKADESGIFFKYNGASKMASITREEFEKLCAPLIHRAMGVTLKTVMRTGKTLDDGDEDNEELLANVEEFLENSGRESDDRFKATLAGMEKIDKFVLVGGGCNMPMIKDGLIKQLKIPQNKIEVYDPSRAIAKGAAIYAKMNSGVEQIQIVDIATHTYGIRTAIDIDGVQIPVIQNSIFRGDIIPPEKLTVEFKGSYVACDDDQNIVSFVVFESDVESEDCIDGFARVGTGVENGLSITVSIPPEYRGRASEYQIYVQFTLDSNGILEIEAYQKDESGNKGRTLAYATSAVKE